MWFLAQNKLATIDNIKNKGMVIPNRCTLCYIEEESSNHIFTHCGYATTI